MGKIIGNTTATPNPRPDWNQTDAAKADFIKNKPNILTEDDVRAIVGEYAFEGLDPSIIKEIADLQTNKQDMLTFDGEYNASTNPAATRQTVLDAVANCLPSVSDNDNGKFLRVDAGVWAAVAIANAETEEF